MKKATTSPETKTTPETYSPVWESGLGSIPDRNPDLYIEDIAVWLEEGDYHIIKTPLGLVYRIKRCKLHDDASHAKMVEEGILC
jgi:hypothetical protein